MSARCTAWLLPEARSRASGAPARLHQRLHVNCPSSHPASESQGSGPGCEQGGFPSTQRKTLRAEKLSRRQLEIISKGTFVDRLRMSLSGWKSLRGFAVFCGVRPCSECRDRGCWVSRTPRCGVFHPSVLQFRVSLKPSPSVGQTSPGTACLLSGCVRTLWGDWGCATPVGTTATPLMGVCFSGRCWCGLDAGCG